MACRQYSLVRNSGSPPFGAVQLARQSDATGPLWTAVAHTRWGDIPGKATGGTCWFPHGGEEHLTDDFSWLVSPSSPLVLIKSDGRGPPQKAVKIGYQNDGGRDQYAAVADTEQWGTIPGKAKDNCCWFSYDGKEHRTATFYWVATLF